MKNFVLTTIMVIFAFQTFAAETKVSKADRQKMAEMHTKMAACLKSDKPMSECQKNMMSSCQKMMGKDGCPMMDHMHGMMKGGMMMDEDGQPQENSEKE